jgi:hypothetical protein
MLITSKKIRKYIYLIIVCCSGTCVTIAMEQPIPETEKKAEEEQVNSFENLSPDLKAHIVSFLETAKDEKEAIRNVKALSLTSKEFYKLINDPLVLGNLIKEISKQFKKTLIDVVLAFSTPNALNWIKGYIQQYPQEKELLNQHLLEAIKHHNKKLLEFLLDVGANVNAQNIIDGSTPLQSAAYWDKKDILELLLKAGANVNQADNDGDTALYWAVINVSNDAIKLLLAAGADINAQNNRGFTPLSKAAYEGRQDIAALLRKHGAVK